MTDVLLLGTFLSAAHGDTVRRQDAAQASLAALRPFGVQPVNLSFPHAPASGALVPDLPVLTRDGTRVTGLKGPVKPVVSEILDGLAAEASARGLTRIGLVNADIVVLPAAIERLAGIDRPAVAIARTETGGGAPDADTLYGVDMFVFDRAFWQRERRRFRPYLLGEPVWDNVYASIARCYGGVLLNRERLVLHERHPKSWIDSPFDEYVHSLATRDRSYFSVWCAYVARAEALRARGGTPEEEYALQDEIFTPPGPAAEAADFARDAWWRMKRALRA